MHRYRVGEFALLTGVSVRTLHHYDRIGLLKPSGRTDAGYRWYTDEDTLRLQQVLTLRYLGFSLSRIAELLQGREFDLVTSIRIQRSVLRDRTAELARIDEALEALLDGRMKSGEWNWALAAGASAVVQEGLTAKGAMVSEYYTQEQIAEEFNELGQKMSTGEQERIQTQWALLLAEVRRGCDLDPTSPEARSILQRWDDLVASTFRGRTKLAASVANGYREGRYADVEGTPTPDDFAFLQRVRDAAASAS